MDAKPELKKPAWLMNGPFHETQPSGEFDQYYKPLGAGVIDIPLDEDFNVTDGPLFAFARYVYNAQLAGEYSIFWFADYKKADDKPFMVRFVDGPFNGLHPFHQPVQALSIVLMPMPSEPYEGEGRQRVLALYKRDGDVLRFDSVSRTVTTDLRILVELVGGPFDGHTFDSDAADSDRDGAFAATAYHFITNGGEVGKKFLVMSPYIRHQLGELGMEAPRGQPHKYVVVDCLPAPYEVLIRAKYEGINQPRKKEPEA